MDIKRGEGYVLQSVPITADAVKIEELMKQDSITLSWRSVVNEIIPLGAYVEYEGERYTLLAPYSPNQVSEIEYEYKPVFHSRIMRWQHIPFFHYNKVDGNIVSKEPDWTLTDNPANFMAVICDAISNETGEEWTYSIADNLPASTSLSFSNVDIFSALNSIANAFNTEWWADKVNNVLHLSKASFGDPAILEVGDNIKVPSVTNSKNGYYTRFYAFGSTRNIAQDYQGANVNNQTNRRLTLDPVKYPNGYKDIRENLTDDEVLSKVLFFDEVYPKSDLVISDVRVRLMWRLDNDSNKVQVGTDDNGDPVYDQYAIWYFKIPDYAFDESSIIAGKALSVKFKSGALSGREFELTYHSEEKKVSTSDGTDFIVNEGDYEINFIEDGSYIIPAITGLIPNDGDEITLFNIVMPEEYKQSAYNELEEELDKEIVKMQSDLNNYSFDSNNVAFYNSNPNLSIGRAVTYKNGSYSYSTRVIKLETKIDYPFEQKITIGNERIKGNTQELKEEVVNANQNIDLLASINEMTNSITQAYQRTQKSILDSISKYNDMFDVDSDGNVYVKPLPNGTPRNFYTFGTMSFGGIDDGESGEGAGTGITSLYDIPEIAVSAANLVDGQSLVYDATLRKWVNRLVQSSGGGLDVSQLENYLTTNNYLTANSSLDWDKLNNTPTTLEGYGVTDNVAYRQTWNDLMHDTNEFTFAKAQHTGVIWINFRTASGDTDGAISEYRFANGSGRVYTKIRAAQYIVNEGTSSQFLKADGSRDSTVYWHAGNDGSNSGLDADLLDGLDEASFMRHSTAINLEDVYLRHIGYGYKDAGWHTTGPAMAFGASNGYTMLMQQGASSYALHVSFKTPDGTIRDWKTIAFTDSDITGSAGSAKVLNNYYTSRPTSADIDIFGDGGVRHILASSSMTNNKPASDGSILTFEWDSKDGYSKQLFIGDRNGISNANKRLQWRSQNAGTWSDWKTVAFTDSTIANAEKLGNYDETRFFRRRSILNSYDSASALPLGLYMLSNNESVTDYFPTGNGTFINLTSTDDSGAVKTNYGLQFCANYAADALYVRSVWYNELKSWKQLAYVTSTVANADKLDGSHLSDIWQRYYNVEVDLNDVKSGTAWCFADWDFANSGGVTNQPWASSAACVWSFPGRYGLQIAKYYNTDLIMLRTHSGSTWNDWKQLAFTDSNITGNAASATKLQTARTIWGRSFNGTGNITSHLELGNSIAIKVTDDDKTLRNALVMDSYNSLLIGSGNVASDAGYMTHIYGKPIRFSISSSNHPVTITSNANVLIGTTNEDITYNEDTKYKLLVSGRGYFSAGATLKNGNAIYSKDTAGNDKALFLLNNNNSFMIGSDIGAAEYSTYLYGHEILFCQKPGGAQPMYISSNSNVLIGYTTDDNTAKLNVQGKIRLSSDLLLNNYTAIKFKEYGSTAELNTIMVGTDNAVTIGADHATKNYETRIKGVGVTLFYGGTQVLSLTSGSNISAKNILPFADDNPYNLGSSNNRWNTIYGASLNLSGNISSGSILPITTNAHTLGSTALRWSSLFANNVNTGYLYTADGNTKVLEANGSLMLLGDDYLTKGLPVYFNGGTINFRTTDVTDLSIGSNGVATFSKRSAHNEGLALAANQFIYTTNSAGGLLKTFGVQLGEQGGELLIGYQTSTSASYDTFIYGKNISFKYGGTTNVALTINANGNAIFYKYLSSSSDGTHLLNWYGEGRFWNLMPQTTELYNLGAGDRRWASAHIKDVVAYNSVKVGDATLTWDAVNQCLVVDKNFVSDGSISFGGLEPPTEDDYLATNGGTILGNLGIGNASNTGKNLNMYGSMYFYLNSNPTAYKMQLWMDGNSRLALRNPTDHAATKFYVYGDIIYNGTSGKPSDMRLKQVLEDMCLSSEIIANAPLFRYKRKDSKDDRIYIGSSAQYWQGVAPELTPLVDDYLTLDYATLGVMMGKSNATEIESLKERMKILEAKVENYERILGII